MTWQQSPSHRRYAHGALRRTMTHATTTNGKSEKTPDRADIVASSTADDLMSLARSVNLTILDQYQVEVFRGSLHSNHGEVAGWGYLCREHSIPIIDFAWGSAEDAAHGLAEHLAAEHATR